MTRTIAKIFVLTLLLVLVVSGVAYAQENENDSAPIYITLVHKADENADEEDNFLQFTFLETDVPPYIVDGTTMIPLRALAEGFGYVVDYQEKDRKIVIQDASGENELVFSIGSTTAFKNGQAETMLQAPVIRNNLTFIPLRYVSEFFNKQVIWKKGLDEKTMYIWVSEVELITHDDVAVEEDDNYYFYLPPTEKPGTYYHYRLKNVGQTYRGIKIGDSYEKVVDLYGEPHREIYKDGALSSIDYYTTALPGTGSGRTITFFFENNIVVMVDVDTGL